MLAQDTFQQYPIVTKDVVEHEAYRAMQSGVDEYLYKVNANADFAACNAKFYNASGTLVGNSTLLGASTRVRRADLQHLDLGAGHLFGQRPARRGSCSSTAQREHSPRATRRIEHRGGQRRLHQHYNYQTAGS